MNDLWSHSHDWDNGYAKGNKDGYEQGKAETFKECWDKYNKMGYGFFEDWLAEQLKEQKNENMVYRRTFLNRI